MALYFKDIRETLIVPAGCRERFLPMQSSAASPLRERGVFLAGESVLSEGYFVARERLDWHLVIYGIGGRGRFEFGGETHVLEEGSVFVGPSGSSYRYAPEDKLWRIVWFHVRASDQWTDLDRHAPALRPSYIAQDVAHACVRMLEEERQGGHGAARAAFHHAELLGIYLERDMQHDAPPAERRNRHTLHQLWNHVETHLDQDWCVDALASHANMSLSHLHRVVRASTGKGPKQVVYEMRMRRAEELLLNRGYPLKVIAAQLGYGTPFAFSVAFKRHAGCSPKAFREKRGAKPSG